jgi:serine-type D-Ala-D-Ala carboxypeptidase/endopeptidase (penicillin-binding protein 4)
MPRPIAGGAPWTPAEISRLDAQIDALMQAPALHGAQVGFIAIDTQRGTLLYSRNADEEFMPASNFKLLVGSTALQRLGLNFSYVTRALADVPPQNGVENGNVYLRGGGDALLSAQDLDNAAAAVGAAGITSITGSVIVDPSHFDDQRLGFGWSWDDLPYYYAPVISALELEDGVVHIYMTPGSAVGDPVRLAVQPQSSAFTIDNELRTGPAGSMDTSDIVRPWDQPRTIVLTGSYPLDAKESGDLHPSVPDPVAYAADVFTRALDARGIDVIGGTRVGRSPAQPFVLWTHDSLPMPQLMQRFWYPSDNLMGELLLKELGVLASGEPGTDEHGADVEREFLRSVGVDPDTVSIADGSGLSQYDRITPRDLLTILQYDWNAPYRDVVLDALPYAGVRGTLEHAYIGTPAEYKVWAKTGSISHVRTISGYIQTETHGVVTFSLLINQWMGEDHPDGPAALARARGAVLSAIVVK